MSDMSLYNDFSSNLGSLINLKHR